MIIRRLEISGIGGIGELKLEFESGWTVICGANGIGKTTILNIIADAFSSTGRIIKKNARYKFGEYTIEYVDNSGQHISKKNQIKILRPEYTERMNLSNVGSEYLMNFHASRDIKYKKLDNIPITDKGTTKDTTRIAVDGIDIDDMKGWFVRRCLFSKQETGLKQELFADLELAKKSFGLLDESVSYDSIDPRSSDIVLNTSTGQIAFEYLSSGYKMCIYIVMGIIKEIEMRFIDNPFKAEEFNGIVLIDEIDLHLHPTWQAKLVATLKKIFPMTQFICTTHSPSILQNLQEHEIIPLGIDQDGNTSIKKINTTPYGFQGWTLEEILTDVMDMPSTTSELYMEIMDEFDKAMYDEDIPKIMENYNILDQMLHPKSIQRKLLQIQMAGLEE